MPRTGTGRLFKRGDTWWIDYSYRGKRFRESSGSEKKKAASDLLKKRLGEMGTGKLIGPAEERLTFEDLASMIETDYKVNRRRSHKRLRASLSRLREFFGMSRAVDVTTDRVRQYIEERQTSGAANATIQNELAALKRAFTLAYQARRLSVRPYIPHLRVVNTREGFFEAADLARVLDHLPADLVPLVRFAALTGWRRGEVMGLQWGDVDFAGGVVRLAPGTTKNEEGREFPFGSLPPLQWLLEDQLQHTRELERKLGQIIPHVFHRGGRPIREFRKPWVRACQEAGVPGALFHDLRRTAVRNLERAGVPRSVAMKLTGHKTEAVYRRYAIADSAALAEGVSKLARLHATPHGDSGRAVVPLERSAG